MWWLRRLLSLQKYAIVKERSKVELNFSMTGRAALISQWSIAIPRMKSVKYEVGTAKYSPGMIGTR